jgi:hypothetical protein
MAEKLQSLESHGHKPTAGPFGGLNSNHPVANTVAAPPTEN